MKKLVLNDDNLWSGKTKTDRQTDRPQERLVRLFITQYPALRPVVDVLGFLVDISDMYNKNQRKENRIFFDAIYRQEGK